jgi:hypothetical protein
VVATGGGQFVPIGDANGLACSLAKLLTDVPAREAASIGALASGERFSDEAVFAHRSALIKRHLVKGSGADFAIERDTSLGRVGA